MRTTLLFSALSVAALPVALALPSALLAQSPVSTLAPDSPEQKLHASVTGGSPATALPDAPVPVKPFSGSEMAVTSLHPCPVGAQPDGTAIPVEGTAQSAAPCMQVPNPYRRFLDTTAPSPMTPMQKGYLAIRNSVDPGNLITIVGTSAYTIGTNAHTAYGPGWEGFGKNVGYSFSQDATGEFFGVFLIPSIAHEDPRYHRMPNASVPRRFVHAISRTVIAQSDNGSLMPNYATLMTYPISAEISNLYVPGINDNGPSTVARILTGYATDPLANLITEFLPDVAKHIHVQVIFVQRILNQVSNEQ
jgi:hypothetical protein